MQVGSSHVFFQTKELSLGQRTDVDGNSSERGVFQSHSFPAMVLCASLAFKVTPGRVKLIWVSVNVSVPCVP